ncbi:MAG: hypothetical protein AAF483_02860 [Planctomycetota bacterium]
MRTILLSCLTLSSFLLTPTSSLVAQTSPTLPRVHYLLDSRQPPGMVASAQANKNPTPLGAFQAVSVSGPEGLQVALAKDGMFLPPLEAPVTTAMLVGGVYRFRVTNIPLRPGAELYPTLEIIDRLYSPPGREHRFPIPVQLTEEDLRLALKGAFVTRVIYVEDNDNAFPFAFEPGQQRTTDVLPTDNALQVADRFGRPVAILRIGSRVPTNLQGDLTQFLYGCPPWRPLPVAPDRDKLIEQGLWPAGEVAESDGQPTEEEIKQDYPRIP